MFFLRFGKAIFGRQGTDLLNFLSHSSKIMKIEINPQEHLLEKLSWEILALNITMYKNYAVI